MQCSGSARVECDTYICTVHFVVKLVRTLGFEQLGDSYVLILLDTISNNCFAYLIPHLCLRLQV